MGSLGNVEPRNRGNPAEGRAHPVEHRGLLGAPTEKEKDDSKASFSPFSPRAFPGGRVLREQ